MVLTFALCATFVFAQTATPYSKGVVKASTKEAKIQNSYSSSIFTKDETTLATVDFHAENEGYSTGVITGGLEGHNQNLDYAFWHRWVADSAALVAASSTYPYITQAWGGPSDFASSIIAMIDTAATTGENGFMMMMMLEQRTMETGNFNAYILIDSVDATSAGIVDVRFFQRYRKYYDHNYIDYCTDGHTWNAVEINVNGVDVSVNNDLAGFISYTLPTAAAGTTVSIRIRWKGLGDRGNAYGYWWLIDDVSVIGAEANRLKQYSQEYVEGNYAQVPQGLQINPAWYGYVQNNGAVAQNNVNATLYHLNAAQDTQTEVDRYNNQGIAVDNGKDLLVDIAGWINPDSMDSRGWYGYIDHSPHGTGIALPTETLGDNYIFATVSNENVTLNYDTMYYKVNGLENGYYRWAHDNGVLVYLPTNYWLYGYVTHDNGEHWYVTDDRDEVHYYDAGYMVTSRFSTDAAVPEGWVIRGVELVASPVEGMHSTGARISGVLLYDEYDGNSVTFRNIMTGANVKEVTANDVNDSNIIGRNTAGYLEQGDYHTIVIEFPEQPALEPNTSYRIGYSLEDESYFALAHESYGRYRMASPTRPDQYDTIIYFRNNEATAKYAGYFMPNVYQSYINDPHYTGSGNSGAFAYYQELNPMIRMLVGPAQAVNRVNINIECEGTDFGTVAYGGNEVCGETITPVEGSSATVVASTAAYCTVESVVVDGEEVEPWDEDAETGDINLHVAYDEESHVYVYQYTFANVQGDHTIKFVFVEGASIDPVAAGVRMNLQPNPASSVVNMNIEGVSGMVNCVLIDMSGRVVYNQNINAETTQTINVSNLAKGAYFVRITNDKFSKVEKLIVR